MVLRRIFVGMSVCVSVSASVCVGPYVRELALASASTRESASGCAHERLCVCASMCVNVSVLCMFVYLRLSL